MNFNKQ
jgi:hypothetical protein